MYFSDYTRLSTPILLLILAAAAGVIAWTGERIPEGWRLFFVLLAIILGSAGIVTMIDWVAHQTAERIKEIERARMAPVLAAASALKGLSTSQIDAVMRFDRTEIKMIVGDESPVFMVRCMTRDVPYDFVDEYIRKSAETPGFLYPVREAGNKEYASEVARLIIAKGWAETWVGPFPAKLKIPLETIAERMGVEL